MVRPLIDSRMLSHLPQFFPSLVTLQSDTDLTTDPYGGDKLDWENVAGLVNLPCAVGPRMVGRVDPSEARTAQMTVTQFFRHISIPGAYPQITVAMRAVVGADIFNILGVELDSHGMTTRLIVENVTT